MIPVEFNECNVIYAKEQSEYIPLPACKIEGLVITCWELSTDEIEKITSTGKLWISMLTFNHPLQPILPTVDAPFTEETKE